MNSFRIYKLNLLLASALLFPIQGHADLSAFQKSLSKPCEDSWVCFPRELNILEGAWAKLGQIDYRYIGFRVFSAGYYTSDTPTATSDESNFLRKPHLLILRYQRSISRDDFIESSIEHLPYRSEEERESQKTQEKEFFALLRSMEAGDQYLLHYRPGKGLELYKNDKFLGSVQASLFVERYFGIWLDSKGLLEEDARQLTGQA